MISPEQEDGKLSISCELVNHELVNHDSGKQCKMPKATQKRPGDVNTVPVNDPP